MSVEQAVAIIALIVALISPVIAWYASSKVMLWRIQRLEKDIDDLRDFKHEHCEPAVRYVDYLKTEKPWECARD